MGEGREGTRRVRLAISDACRDLLDAVLDRHCPGCGGSPPRTGPVCAACDARVGRSGTVLCLRCLQGEATSPVPFGRGCPDHGPTRLLLAGPPFEHPLDRILHAFKYEGASSLASWISSLLPEPPGRLEGIGREFVIVPVPLHPARKARRGFDQVSLLARHLSERSGLPVVDALERCRDHEPQARLDPARRRVNLTGAFRVPRPRRIEDRPVLLVDDVATTGSTLLAAAESLERAGAQWIISMSSSHGGFRGMGGGTGARSPRAG